MKKLLTISTLVIIVMFSSTSFAEWTRLGRNVSGDIQYVDFERIRKHDGYVYFWSLSDHLKPTITGHLSMKMYRQGDCKIFRYKDLSISFYKEPMGKRTELVEEPVLPDEVSEDPPVSQWIKDSLAEYRTDSNTSIYQAQPTRTWDDGTKGTGKTYTYPNAVWKYPHPNSVNEVILKSVCSH